MNDRGYPDGQDHLSSAAPVDSPHTLPPGPKSYVNQTHLHSQRSYQDVHHQQSAPGYYCSLHSQSANGMYPVLSPAGTHGSSSPICAPSSHTHINPRREAAPSAIHGVSSQWTQGITRQTPPIRIHSELKLPDQQYLFNFVENQRAILDRDGASGHYSKAQRLYPGLLPSYQFTHNTAFNPSVKLMQSCDGCRRRKIRCSSKKPACSACIRYNETCHYSPLAPPRKKVKGNVNNTSFSEPARTHKADTDGDKQPLRGSINSSIIPIAGKQPDAEMRQIQVKIKELSSKFDSLDDKIDRLGEALLDMKKRTFGKTSAQPSKGAFARRREANARIIHDLNGSSSCPSGADQSGLRRAVSWCRGIRTSRFCLDTTNFESISNAIANELAEENRQYSQDLGKYRRQPSHKQSLKVVSERTSVDNGEGSNGNTRWRGRSTDFDHTQLVSVSHHLEQKGVKNKLIDVFYKNADLNTLALVPRCIFEKMRRDDAVSPTMTYSMLSYACHTIKDSSVLDQMDPMVAQSYYAKQAFESLIECSDYDSIEQCVAVIIFVLSMSKVGIYRTCIFNTQSIQMAVRLRLNHIDSAIGRHAFKDDDMLTKEWKRRVMWQLCTLDVMTSTLIDITPQVYPSEIRCSLPVPFGRYSRAGCGGSDSDHSHLKALGPVIIFCDDQDTISEQAELLGILCDISQYQIMLDPDSSLFPQEFAGLESRLKSWQKKIDGYESLRTGSAATIISLFRRTPGRVLVALMCQYAWIHLCLIEDIAIPKTRALTGAEHATLGRVRGVCARAANFTHRLVPLLQSMEPSAVGQFASCIVYQACIVSVYAYTWFRDSDIAVESARNVQRGLEFLDSFSAEFRFAQVLSTSLRKTIIECGFGIEDVCASESVGACSVDGSCPGLESLSVECDAGERLDAGSESQPIDGSDFDCLVGYQNCSELEEIMRTGLAP